MKARFQPKYNIKKGDLVVVIAGDDKDLKTPRTVVSVTPDAKNPKVIIEGVALATKHKKPNAQNPQGAIVKEEAAISLSNVMLWDAKAGAGTKVKRDRSSGKAVRISKKTNQAI
jgi:large subunit ribosomal protein L24